MPQPVATQAVTRDLPPQLRLARLLPESFNAEARTIDLVWSVGGPGRRNPGGNRRDIAE
jgi:hypothetical protein